MSVRGYPDSGTRKRDVRFTPMSRHRQRDRLRPKSANLRHRLAGYSISSSALPRSDVGTVIPRTLAVFKLGLNSILVDCCTGRSAGFSPFNTFAVIAPAIRYDSFMPPP